jgi:hypothetical protein
LPLSYLASALRGLLDLAATKISAGMIISGLVQQKATTSVLTEGVIILTNNPESSWLFEIFSKNYCDGCAADKITMSPTFNTPIDELNGIRQGASSVQHFNVLMMEPEVWHGTPSNK